MLFINHLITGLHEVSHTASLLSDIVASCRTLSDRLRRDFVAEKLNFISMFNDTVLQCSKYNMAAKGSLSYS